MGVMLCSQTDPAFSMELEALGIRVYSMEELCYCILHYPLLLFEDLPGTRILRFLEKGAGEKALAEQLRRQCDGGTNLTSLLERLLELSGYCDAAALQAFRRNLLALRGLSKEARWKKRGDLFFSLRRYGKAIGAYEQALEMAGEEQASSRLVGKILFNRGCAYANLFCSDKAFFSFQRAYDILKDKAILKAIYFLSRREAGAEERARFLSALGGKMEPGWEEAFEEACRSAAQGNGKKTIDGIFSGDPIQRARATACMIQKWKEEYRTML